jgi:putative membrane protein (TIGR04086 family)
MAKKKRRKKSVPDGNADLRTVIIKALISSATGIIVFFIITAVLSLVGWKSDMPESAYKYMILAAGAISGFVCGFAAVRPIRKNGIAVGALSALPAYFIIVLISTTLSRTGISKIGWILLPVMIVFAAVGGILAVNKRK